MNVKGLALVVFVSACAQPQTTRNMSQPTEAINAENSPNLIFSGTQELESHYFKLPRQGSKSTWVSESWNYKDEGIAGVKRQGDLSPSEKYDKVFNQGTQATDWERINHGTNHGTRPVADWWGHCNGAAASVVLAREPKKSVVVDGVTFSPWDIKALMAEAFYNAKTTLVGLRCNETGVLYRDPNGRVLSGPCRDLNAGSFHVVVTNLLGTLGKHPIVDLDSSNQVWNAPITSYKISDRTLQAREANKLISDNVVSSDEYAFNPAAIKLVKVYLETKYIYHGEKSRVFEYIVELDSTDRIIGGEWIGDSKKRHPDFVWYPESPASANPHINVDRVLDIASRSF